MTNKQLSQITGGISEKTLNTMLYSAVTFWVGANIFFLIVTEIN